MKPTICAACGRPASDVVTLRWEGRGEFTFGTCGRHPAFAHLLMVCHAEELPRITNSSPTLPKLGGQNGDLTPLAGLAALKIVGCEAEDCSHNRSGICFSPDKFMATSGCDLARLAEALETEVE